MALCVRLTFARRAFSFDKEYALPSMIKNHTWNCTMQRYHNICRKKINITKDWSLFGCRRTSRLKPRYYEIRGFTS
jgi:hypothetical protein